MGTWTFSRLAPVLLFTSNAAFAAPAPNVILVTLDGVRPEEVFQGVDPGLSLDTNPKIFEFLTGEASKQGALLGDKAKGHQITVSL